MSAQQLAVWVLLGAAALVVVLSGVGLLGARDSLPRLHFVTPVTSVAAPLTGVAYAVDQGWGIPAGLVLAIVGLVAVTGPPLGAAIGRAAARNEGRLPGRGPA
jgi:multisubunit Na+/H+ antiporter MnhG subunit